jgi:hypothetical protein
LKAYKLEARAAHKEEANQSGVAANLHTTTSAATQKLAAATRAMNVKKKQYERMQQEALRLDKAKLQDVLKRANAILQAGGPPAGHEVSQP